MKEDFVLEENQSREFSDVVATYQFTCEGGGAVSKYPSPKLIVKKAGIRLHFLRRGLFYKKEESINFVANPNAGVQYIDNLRGIHFDQFIIGNRSLRAGYLYIFDENKADLWYEFEIDEMGLLAPIYWAKNKHKGIYKDIRTKTGSKEREKIFKQGKVLSIAYSSVQWSVKYHQSMLADADKRAKYMTKAVCSGFEKGMESAYENIYPYNEITAGYTANEKPQEVWFEQKLNHIQANEEDSPNKDNLLEDMFVVLDDVIGAMFDISKVLSDEITKHRANVEAIQTGRDPDAVYERMTGEPASWEITDDEAQMGAMVHLAMTTYKLVYNSDDMIKDYCSEEKRAGIDKEKLLNILGVKERKQQRQKIYAIQDDLGTLIQSDIYQNSYAHHAEDTPANLLDGKYCAMQPLRLLAINPHDIDRSFDLNKDYQENKKWDALIKDTICETTYNPFFVVLNKELDIDETLFGIAEIVDLSNKLAGFIVASLEAYSKIAIKDILITETVSEFKHVKVKGNFDLLLKRLKQLKVYGEEVFEVRYSEVEDILAKNNMEVDKTKVKEGKYKGKGDVLRWNKAKSPAIKLKSSIRGKHLFNIPIVTNEIKTIHSTKVTKLDNQEVKPYGKKAKALLDNAPFRGVVAILQVFNISVAYKVFYNDPTWKTGVNLGGVAAELSSAILSLTNSLKSGSPQTIIGKYAARANIAGLGITVITCSWNAFESSQSRDHDAAAAWGVAAAGFSAATAATIFATAAWAGPVGWIGAGIGLIAVFMAYYLKDNPLETYFKNFAFSNWEEFNSKGEKTYLYNRRFYKFRRTMVKKEYYRWNNFKLAGAELTDMLVCSNIRFLGISDGDKKYTPSIPQYGLGKSTKIKEGYVSNFKIEISFRQFLRSEDQLSYNIFFYENGINRSLPSDVSAKVKISLTEGTSQTSPAIVISFTLPDNLSKNTESCILFICRLHIDADKYYPVEYDNTVRYLGAFSGIYSNSQTIYNSQPIEVNSSYQGNIKIDTLKNLKSGKAWQKK